jgi:hypothetical protein
MRGGADDDRAPAHPAPGDVVDQPVPLRHWWAPPDPASSAVGAREREAQGPPRAEMPQPRRSSRAGGVTGSETPLPPSQSTAASLALERLPAGRSIASRARAARIERARAVTARRAVFGGVDGELSPVDLAVVEEADRLDRLGLAGELDEGEPPRAPGLTIGGEVDLDDGPRRGQEVSQGIRRGPEVQIPDEEAR